MWKLSFLLLSAAITQGNCLISLLNAPKAALKAVIPDTSTKLPSLTLTPLIQNLKKLIPEEFKIDFSVLNSVDFGSMNFQNIKEIGTGFGIFNLGTEVQKMEFKFRNRKGNYTEEILTPEKPLSFLNSSWDPKQNLTVVIHGYTEDSSGWVLSTTSKIIDAYVIAGSSDNLVFVDWRYLARQPNYFDSAKNTVKAGMRVAELLITLRGINFLTNLDNVHIVGFSLGAHVSGIAAYCCNSLMKGEQVGRVTGLDPAGPGFRDESLPNRLDASDAKFVDVIHTNMGKYLWTFGINIKCGHVDFYPNGGEHQKGSCDFLRTPELVGVCSHTKAPEYYSNTIVGTKYTGCPCSDWDTFKSGSCPCTNKGAIMGEYADPNTRGDYYLTIL